MKLPQDKIRLLEYERKGTAYGTPSAVPYFPLFFLSKNYFFLFLFSTVMSASISMMTAVSALMIVMLMMAAYGIRIVVQCSGDKRFYLCICVSLCARVKPDVRFCKCISGCLLYTSDAADE